MHAILAWSLLAFCACLPVAAAETVTVRTVSELLAAVADANAAGGQRTILLADGTYTLPTTLQVTAPGIAIVGAADDPERVVIEGDALAEDAVVGVVVRVAAVDFRLQGVTVQKGRYHAVQVAGEADADRPVLRNCILRDTYQQLLKVSVDRSDTSISADEGLVEDCLFEYSAGIGPNFYIGGIDALGAKRWTVRRNTVRYITSPHTALGGFGIHFWSGSADNVVERNLIVDCDRAIGFGLDGGPNTGGTIRNNIIQHSGRRARYADVGIALIESPGSEVYHNTVFMEHAYPNAIEYRFPSTVGALVVNNLTNRRIVSRNGASARVEGNVTTARPGWFVAVNAGNLRLASAVPQVVDVGRPGLTLTDDYDGEPRPQGSAPDVGADELASR